MVSYVKPTPEPVEVVEVLILVVVEDGLVLTPKISYNGDYKS